jgi:hypothetical protein
MTVASARCDDFGRLVATPAAIPFCDVLAAPRAGAFSEGGRLATRASAKT